MPDKPIKHLLGLSGGRDSAALAIYMRQSHPELDIEYFFTDTGKELPEVYDFLFKLEGFLGKQVNRLNPDRDFDFWLGQYNNYLPSAQARWCTKDMKLRPFTQWAKSFVDQGFKIYNYVAIRADEPYREGYRGTEGEIETILPFREEGLDKAAIIEILETSGVGLPEYYTWRTRSGCTFCFFQRKIEWVGLMERHPAAFEEAKAYEKTALDNGAKFTWCRSETLDELAHPDRVAKIKADHQKALERAEKRKEENPLRPSKSSVDLDDIYSGGKGCVICHK